AFRVSHSFPTRRSSDLMTEQNVPISADAQATITNKISEGKTTVIVAHGGHTCGVIGISDKIRNESRTAVQELGKMGILTIMLTRSEEHTSELQSPCNLV